MSTRNGIGHYWLGVNILVSVLNDFTALLTANCKFALPKKPGNILRFALLQTAQNNKQSNV